MHYQVFVKFNKDFIDIDEENRKINIGVRARPVKGKANEEIIKKIAEYFKIPSSKVRITAGLRSKSKIIEILDE